jgi:tetratricopeptide (TPR) repeat protein
MNREEVLRKVENHQSRAKAFTKRQDWKRAEAALLQAINELEDALNAGSEDDGSGGATHAGTSWNEIARALADSYGMLGGIYRRQGRLEEAINAYTTGSNVEQNERYDIINSYNLTNSLVLPVVVHPEHVEKNRSEIQRAADLVRGQVQGKRRDQWWAWADLGLLALLSDQPDVAKEAYAQFRRNGARASDFRSTIAVLKECQDALRASNPALAQRLNETITDLTTTMPAA